MILLGFTWTELLLGVLYISLAVLVIAIGYRRLIKRFSKGHPDRNAYLELYSLDQEPCSGELVFFFEAPVRKDFRLLLLDDQMNEIREIASGESLLGGNIVRFDSGTLANGVYFYALVTDTQKSTKRMTLLNESHDKVS